MDLADALERIDTIHTHLARGEQYQGYRPASLALSGVAGVLAAFMQPLLIADASPLAFVVYWVIVALLAAGIAASGTLVGYLFREGDLARRRTRIVVRQFAPCLLAGIIVTLALTRGGWREFAIPVLPPLWALLFGLGTVASLPYLPRLAVLVAGWYFASAVVLFFSGELLPGGWAVGLSFGIGQLLAAFVLALDRREEPA